jgi:hypothetical protein
MTAARSRRGTISAFVAAVPCALLAAVGLGAFPSAPAAGDALLSAPLVAAPLATSVQSAAGTWATVPMGHLNQPLNTFWQLFFRPTGTTSWSNQAEATAVATNGGLVLASAVGQPLVAGVRPSNFLHFSPLIATDDGGDSWSNGLLPEGLAASPGALSRASNGQTLALVNGGLGARVLASTGGLSSWRTLTTARRLASSGGGIACGLRALTATAAGASSAVVGASCSRPGVVGIFSEQAGGSWRLEPLALPGSLRRGRVEVLTLEQTAGGLAALLGVSEKTGTALVAAWTTGANRWIVSPVLPLASNEHLVSLGPASASGLFAVYASSSGPTRLAVIDGPSSTWHQMPSPPSGTATVAFDPTSPSTADALVVHDATMSVWTLGTASGGWMKGQVVHVALEFGSSG